MKRALIILSVSVMLPSLGTHAQNATRILGRPTDTSITISLMIDKSASVFIEYGTSPGVYAQRTPEQSVSASQPLELDLRGLQPNTRYFYRMGYRLSEAPANTVFSSESFFSIQRQRGTTFSFAVEADPHLDTNTVPESYALTLQHMLSKKVDFLVDLGDNFMNDKQPVQNEASVIQRNVLFRDYFSILNQSASLFIAMGNHEGELGWLYKPGQTDLTSIAANVRKKYYPNPFPNGFYSGNTVPTEGVGLRENYYAWEWGDALFVVIDPYFYTLSKPGWGWTLGVDQYNWLSNTLKRSTARYKFVFSHQLVGGSGTEGRGGTEFVHLFEMGGYNEDSTWGFTTRRPGWEMPIHNLFVATKVSVFFHGHDHCYGRQVKDGVVYQEVPQPSARNIQSVTGTAYGYKEGVFLPNRGYMLVTVGPDSAKVDYVRTYLPNEENATRKNGDIAYSYPIRTDMPTAIDDPIPEDLLRIHPNPVVGTLHIQPKRTFRTFHYRLVDLAGRVVATGNGSEVDTRRLPAGNYVLQVQCDQFIVNRKVFVGN